MSATTNASTDTLFNAFTVLNRYCSRRVSDASALHLLGLISERLGNLSFASQSLQQAIQILEEAYEENENSTIERQFAIATCNLARIKLSRGEHEEAFEKFESVLGLLDSPAEDAEDADGVSEGSGDQERTLLRAQAQLGSGLSQSKLGDLDAAVGHFEAALLSYQSIGTEDMQTYEGQLMVLWSKVLWATQTEEARENAKGQLLEW